MIKKQLFCFCLMFVLIACSKKGDTNPEVSKLPAATQTGANTCGCLLNGKAWTAGITDSGFVQTIGPRVFARLHGVDSSSLDFVLRGYIPTVNTAYNIHNGFGWSSFGKKGFQYHSSQNTSNTGTITFSRFDTASRIMSGTFSFTYKSPSGNQQTHPDLVFTSCRFDFRFKIL
jgi:hypothetical protein